MPEKRTTRRRSPKRTADPVSHELSEAAVVRVLEGPITEAPAISVDAETRRRLVAAEAYFIAERRGFAAGHEFEDWIEAEHVVDARLRELRAA